jgi:hypothetical protein
MWMGFVLKRVSLKYKKSLKIPKGKSTSVNQRTDNIMAKKEY